MRFLAMVCAISVAAAVLSAPPSLASAGTDHGSFAASDLSILAGMPATETVRLVLVGRVGRGDELADQVRERGGTIRTVDDAAGFVVVETAAARARSLNERTEATVLALDRHGREPARADELSSRPKQSKRAATASAAQYPRVGPINPYLPTAAIGAPQFVRAHPRFDGRGVRVAVVDSYADWTVDGLRTTTTGLPKVARSYSRDPAHLVRSDQIQPIRAGQFTVDDVTYTVPKTVRASTVRFGKLSETKLDLDLDGIRDETFGVAVFSTSPRRHVVYVDTDGDHSFADETKLSDWNASHATATFGRDRSDTPHVVEVRSFGLNLCQPTGVGPCAAATDGEPGDLWSLVTGDVGTSDASVAAGHDLRLGGGRFDGAAPGAQVWMFDPHGPNRDVWASDWATTIVLAAREGADVVVASAALGPWLYADHVDVLSPLVDNVIDGYDVPVVSSAGGTVGLGAADSAPQGSRKALLAAPIITPETYKVLMGRSGLEGERFGDPFVTPGPHSRTGRPIPDVLAPSPTVFAYPKFLRQLGAGHAPGLPEGALPPGLSAGFRWGMAAPMAGGAMALLISAARAERIPYTAHSLKRALELGGRPLRGDHTFSPGEIGHGLVQVERSWHWLKRISTDRPDLNLQMTVRGDYPSGVGDSIYQRTSSRATETVTLTSTDRRSRTYKLRVDQPWIGLDRETVTTPGATSFAVRIDPSVRRHPGVHTGTVIVDDPRTADPADHRMAVTVVTPLRLTEANDHQLRLTGDLPAETHARHFVLVPEGTKRLTLTLTKAASTPVGANVYYRQPDPDGHPWELIHRLNDPAEGSDTAVIDNPTPGVLELTLHAADSRSLDRQVADVHSYDLTVRLDT